MSVVRQRHIGLMRLTGRTISNLLQTVDATTAVTLRDPDDGEKGWTILEIMGHLRDFEGYFHGRAQMILDQDTPELPGYDHEALAIAHRYNEQNLAEVIVDWQQKREAFLTFFHNLTDEQEQWERAGIHPERGHFTLTDALMQVSGHDIVHLEQMTRILASK
jgi:hypothetical protein